MKYRLILISTLAFVSASVASIAATGSAGVSHSQNLSVRAGAVLTDTTFGTGTQIDTIDMLSDSVGYAVASPSNTGRGWFYLVKTTNIGNSWNVEHVLPLASFVGMYGANLNPDIRFVSSKIGYTSVQNGPLYVTDDAGQSWSKMPTPGIWPTFVVSGDVVSVVSDVCHGSVPAYGPLKCPSELTQFPLGGARPMRTELIPVLGRAGEWRAATALASTSPQSIVVSEGGSEGSTSSLLSSTNGGSSWKSLSDPCEGLRVDQLIAAKHHKWLLYCFLDGGMNQGNSALWASSDQGNSWTAVAHANEMSESPNSIRDVANTIYSNNRGSVLYGALGGAAGGLEISTDGGVKWTPTSIPTNLYGGSPEYMSMFGETSAIFGIESGPQYRTLNGKRWVELPSLPAGKYLGHSICTVHQGTEASLGASVIGIPATTIDYPVVFTNHGNVSCYLNGIPTAQPVVGPGRDAVGQAAFPEEMGARGGFVTLKSRGGRASIVFERESATTYSRSYCVPKVMGGIKIKFASPSAFYVKIPREKVCTGAPTVNVGGVVSGLTSWL
jgi:photosystem II stability/assembly factor-like uncharacterized protein